MNPNETPQARLAAMVIEQANRREVKNLLEAVALDLLTQLDAANARAGAAEAHRAMLVEALEKAELKFDAIYEELRLKSRASNIASTGMHLCINALSALKGEPHE